MTTSIEWTHIGPSPHLATADCKKAGARSMDEEWVRAIRDRCVAAGIAFFYKQSATRSGRKIPLPVLDGRQWTEMPKRERGAAS